MPKMRRVLSTVSATCLACLYFTVDREETSTYKFLHNIIPQTPVFRIQDIRSMRSKDDANERGQWRLGQEQTGAYERGEKGGDDQKGRQKERGQMRPVRFKLLPIAHSYCHIIRTLSIRS